MLVHIECVLTSELLKQQHQFHGCLRSLQCLPSAGLWSHRKRSRHLRVGDGFEGLNHCTMIVSNLVRLREKSGMYNTKNLFQGLVEIEPEQTSV